MVNSNEGQHARTRFLPQGLVGRAQHGQGAGRIVAGREWEYGLVVIVPYRAAGLCHDELSHHKAAWCQVPG